MLDNFCDTRTIAELWSKNNWFQNWYFFSNGFCMIFGCVELICRKGDFSFEENCGQTAPPSVPSIVGNLLKTQALNQVKLHNNSN